jgi:hypothetical protein
VFFFFFLREQKKNVNLMKYKYGKVDTKAP